MLHQFRHLYPQGSLVSELINIDRGLYIVKVLVQNQGIVLGTGLAAADTIEKAEDKARERALMIVNLDQAVPKSVAKPPASTKAPAVTKPTISDDREASLGDRPEPVPAMTTASATTINNHQVSTNPEPTQPTVADFNLDTSVPETSLETTSAVETQTNIFDQPISSAPVEPVEEVASVDTPDTIEFDFNDIKHKIDLEMKRLSWTREQGRDYLLSTYGKRSRLHLTDPELLEFLEYLENLPN